MQSNAGERIEIQGRFAAVGQLQRNAGGDAPNPVEV